MADAITSEGGCFCGAVRYRVTAPPTRVNHCHCTMCRRLSGAAFVTWATFSNYAFSYLRGRPSRLVSSSRAEREFCKDCGTPLTWRSRDGAGTVDVTVCSFDDPNPFSPAEHIWTASSPAWLHLDDGLPYYPQQRG